MIDIDTFITKYKDENFNALKNVSIVQRSSDGSEAVYVVGKFEGNEPVYFVTYNLNRKTITQIDNTKLKENNLQDYFTNDEIESYIETIRKYGFYLLAVDSDNNLYVNPFYSGEPPYLLRLNSISRDSTVRKGYVYELYRDNWYLNKTRVK